MRGDKNFLHYEIRQQYSFRWVSPFLVQVDLTSESEAHRDKMERYMSSLLEKLEERREQLLELIGLLQNKKHNIEKAQIKSMNPTDFHKVEPYALRDIKEDIEKCTKEFDQIEKQIEELNIKSPITKTQEESLANNIYLDKDDENQLNIIISIKKQIKIKFRISDLKIAISDCGRNYQDIFTDNTIYTEAISLTVDYCIAQEILGKLINHLHKLNKTFPNKELYEQLR